MEVTIIKPGVMAPSQTPSRNRHAKRAPNDLQAAWQHKMIAQRKMFKLGKIYEKGKVVNGIEDARHPLSNGKALESQILGVLKQKVAKVEDCPQPVKLVCTQVSILTSTRIRQPRRG